MDLLLRKMKTAAEDARKWSFEASRYKEELEVNKWIQADAQDAQVYLQTLRVSAQNEKAAWMTRMREKDRIIGTLNVSFCRGFSVYFPN